MATGGLYGQSSAGIVSPQSGSESSGLYGNNTVFGGSYFEWFIFQVADVQPATPTGGSWDFTTNTGTPPSGWLASPPANPTNTVWVSVGVVSSKNNTAITWSEPGKFSFASGLPILSGSSTPLPGDGQSDQLYIETGTTPETIWFKQAGTWTRLTGSNLYMDLVNNQTIGGTKTFSSEIQGSISGTSSNVTGIVDITHGGTGSTTASAARTALGAAASGANSDITSLTAITNGISTPDFIQFDTGITPTTAVGKLQWDPTWQGPQIGMGGGNVNLQIGQETLIYVHNTTGSTLVDGQVVYVTGSQGQRVTVALAQANSDSTSAAIIGMVTENIPNNSSGFVNTQGMVNAINTSGFTDGSVIYLSPTTAGAWTATKPQAPQHTVMVGYIVKGGSVGAGSVYINTQNGYELDELHDVKITSRAAYNLLRVNSTNTVWENIAGPTGAVVGTTDTQTLTNKTISGSSNTLSNISNASLTNSAITINGSSTALGGSVSVGTVTSVGGTGTVNGLTLTGTVTSTGNLTLGGTLSGVANSALTNSAITFGATSQALGSTVSALNAVSVGQTTAAAGSFTTLSASSTVTVSAGTANGVAYLNGSKVLTTGSALVFDGTKLGIGTSSPANKLHVTTGATGVQALFSNASGTPTIAIGNSATNYNLQLGYNVSSEYGYIQATAATGVADDIVINPNGGNLGLGVTPSATNSTYFKALEVGRVGQGVTTATNSLTGSPTTWLSNNSYATYSAGVVWNYANSQPAALYRLEDAAHKWYTAPSGTAGTAITFTQAMTLDASGNLGIGTSSPTTRLHVKSSTYTFGTTKAEMLRIEGALSGGTNTLPTSKGAIVWGSGAAEYAAINAITDNPFASDRGALAFSTNVAGTLTEAMRLDSSGNVGIGTSSPANKLHVKGATGSGSILYDDGTVKLYGGTSGSDRATLGTLGAYPLDLLTYGVVRARINSSGNLLLNTTSDTIGSNICRQVISGTSQGPSLGFSNFGDGICFGIYFRQSTTTATPLAFDNSSGTRIGSITTTNTATSYNTSSDYRLKENIAPIAGALSLVQQLKPVTYNWKVDGSEGQGFIAHELQAVVPDCVTGEKDAVDADGTPQYQGIDTSFLVATLTAAIQEQQAIIESLKARLDAANL